MYVTIPPLSLSIHRAWGKYICCRAGLPVCMCMCVILVSVSMWEKAGDVC